MFKPWSILTNEKNFADPVVGNATLNRAGLHILRILLSDATFVIRTLPLFWLAPRLWWRFHRDGFVVVNNFLPQESFDALVKDYEARSEAHSKSNPLVKTDERGFGTRIDNPGGFDRNDGDSVNRFIDISPESVIYEKFCRSPRMARLTLALFGVFNRPKKHCMYELVHGEESMNPDIQRQMHIDTFHHAFKLWYYIDEVDGSQGPTEYVVGSQRSTLARLKWSYNMSLNKSRPEVGDKGGSFRIDDADMAAMKLRPPAKLTVSRNTLVLVDTKGFHRRGLAQDSTVRRGLYANFRPWAFLPIVF